MADPVSSFATRLAYGATQLPRVAWYLGHGAVRRLSNAQRRSSETQPRAQAAPSRAGTRLYAEMAKLFRQDLANVGWPSSAAGGSRRLVAHPAQPFAIVFPTSLPSSAGARSAGIARCAARTARQAAGLLSAEFSLSDRRLDDEGSAQRYDTQVEVLFKGTANAIRRQALPPLHEIFAGRDQRRLQLLDIGCGTGRFLDFVKQAWPRLPALGLVSRPTSPRRSSICGVGAGCISWSRMENQSPSPLTARTRLPAFSCFMSCHPRCVG